MDASEQAVAEAQRRLDSALIAGEVGTFEWDVLNDRLWGDPNFARIFSISLDETGAAPLKEYLAALHPDDRDGVNARVQETVETGRDYEAEYRIVTNGQTRWVVARGKAERDAAGRVARFAGVVLDITHQKQAEQALRASETRYRALFEAIDEGFCVIQVLFDEHDQPVDYRFLEINPAWEEHTGLRNGVGRTARELLPDLEEHWFRTYGQVALTGEPTRFESGSDVMERWFDVFAFRVGEPEQRKVALLFSDISEQKRTEAALSESRDRFRSVLENSLDAAYRRDLRSDTYDYLSPAVQQVLGIPAGRLQEMPVAGLIERIHPADRERVQQAMAEAARSHRGRVEYRFAADGGEYRWVADHFTVQVDGAGAPAFRTGIVRDVSRQKQAEAALRRAAGADAFRLALSDVLRPLVDPVEIQAAAARTLGRHLEASRVLYARITDGGRYALVAADYTDGVASVAGRHSVDPFGAAVMEALQAGGTIVVRDVQADPRLGKAERDAVAALDIAAFIVVPLVKDGRPVASLVVHQARPREWSEDDVALVREAAERTWEAVERGRAQVALRESEERLRLTIDAAGLGIWEHRLAAGHFRLDARAQEHYAAGPVVSMEQFLQRIHPGDRERLEGEIRAALDPVLRAPVATEYRVVHPEGHVVWLRVQGRVEFTGPGADASAVRGIGTTQDVSERKREEEERERLLREAEVAQAEAETANRSKADFLAAMSHELRTPLNAIGGYVDLLDLGVHGPVSEDQQTALVRITANQQHLLRLINDILQFTRLEAGRMEFDMRRLDARALLPSMEPLVSPSASARGIAYSVRACEGSVHLWGDEERVRQILLNLVNNAIKFTPTGGWVLLACDADERWVSFRVRDNGVGISPEKQEAIFDPFTQVDRRLDRPQEGVGLGLAISRDLARGMGGELTVESIPGQGSTFTLRLRRLEEPDAGGGEVG